MDERMKRPRPIYRIIDQNRKTRKYSTTKNDTRRTSNTEKTRHTEKTPEKSIANTIPKATDPAKRMGKEIDSPRQPKEERLPTLQKRKQPKNPTPHN